MHAAVGHRSCDELRYRLVHAGAMSQGEREAAREIDNSTLHEHRNTLGDVGLVDKCKRTERAEDGLYT